jgi:hypothetical protein
MLFIDKNPQLRTHIKLCWVNYMTRLSIKKLVVTQEVKEFPTFYGSSLCSQQPATSPYHQSDEPSL